MSIFIIAVCKLDSS